MPIGKEDLELIKFFKWVRFQEKQDPRLAIIYHVANERKTGWKAGEILKQKGVLPGVCDIIVPIPSNGLPGLFIEMKHGTNVLSDAQERFCSTARKLGYAVHVAYSAKEAIQCLVEYLRCPK